MEMFLYALVCDGCGKNWNPPCLGMDCCLASQGTADVQGTAEELHSLRCHSGRNPRVRGEDDVQATSQSIGIEVGLPSVSHAKA
eukprot:10239972-Ditylum_brightwellii.AAC.1